MTPPAAAAPVAATDRVSDVLARDESLVEVFARHAPHFAKLRNRTMRRVMARLVTVEQAARAAGLPVEALLRDLNEALGVPAGQAAVASPAASFEALGPVGDSSDSSGQGPAHPPRAHVVDIDVRDDLRSGREPFSKIMAAVSALGSDEVLHLRAIFEPAPLFTVLGKRGLSHESREHAPDDWSVWFWRPAAGSAPPATQPPTAALPGGESGLTDTASDADPSSNESVPATVWLDVRGLEPPQPLLQTLSALETLPAGHSLVQVNVRVPRFLLPMLAERGYACEIDESRTDRVFVRIWRPT